jgi:hypothetical protein
MRDDAFEPTEKIQLNLVFILCKRLNARLPLPQTRGIILVLVV